MSVPSAVLTSVDGLPYYAPAKCIPTAGAQQIYGRSDGSKFGPIPSSLFMLNPTQGRTADILDSIVEEWLKRDDVFRAEFLNRLFILTSEANTPLTLDNDTKDLLRKWQTRNVFIITHEPMKSDGRLPFSGPYFSCHDGLHPAWRIFPDSHGAFVFPAVPMEDDDRKQEIHPPLFRFSG